MRLAARQPGRTAPRSGSGRNREASWIRPAPAILAALLAALGAAGCRSGGPRRPEVGGLELTDIEGHIEMVARDRRRNQESKVGAGNTRVTETVFEEDLKLKVDGYAYHPNFLEFTAAGLFGLLQHDFEEDLAGSARTDSERGDILEFDLEGRFLKKKPYPGTVFARRHRALEARPFQSSLETTTTSFGLTWQYVSEKTPTSLQFSSTQVDLDPLSREEQAGKQENTSVRFETGYNISENHALSFVYDRLSVSEEPFELNYDSDEATLTHRLGFGGDRRHQLESDLNYFNQRGSFEVERFRWRERLRLEHTEKLRSRYLLEIIDRVQGSLAGVQPIEERSYSGSAMLEHELYDSLVSQFQVHARVQRFESGLDVDRHGAYANFDYRKKNRWGSLQANYRFSVLREERSGGDQSVEILDERQTFRDPEPITLNSTNVVVPSIQITAEDRTTFFRRGADYTVQTIGDRVEIRRVPTGRILDGQTVLIDYLFEVGGSFVLDTVTHYLTVRQNFAFGLAPYYRLRWQDQTLRPVEAEGVVPEDITSHLIGVEYQKRSFRLSAEYEDHDSTVTPFRAVRLGADYRHQFKFGATGIVKARWSDVSRGPPAGKRETQFFTMEGRYRHPITADLTVEAAVFYRNEDDSVSGDDEGFDVDLSLEWMVRQTEVRVTFEFGEFEDDFARNDHQLLYVQVRRRF